MPEQQTDDRQPPALWWSPTVAAAREHGGTDAPGVLREVAVDGGAWFYELGPGGLSLRALPDDAVPLRAPATTGGGRR